MHRYIRKLLALSLLPGKDISTKFQQLKLQTIAETLQTLIKYIEDTWGLVCLLSANKNSM